MNTVYTKIYAAPSVNEREILRYAGARETSPEVDALLRDALAESLDKLTYKVCYAEFPVTVRDGVLDLGFMRTSSAHLAKNLQNCGKVIVFAATVGLQLDRLIARYGTVSPAKALMLQAIGAERIESLCDIFNREVTEQAAEKGKGTAPRFSPGYGDLPIDVQKDIFRILDCPRKIGLTLNDSMLMSPSKSVTALIGIRDAVSECGESDGCTACGKNDCSFRRNT